MLCTLTTLQARERASTGMSENRQLTCDDGFVIDDFERCYRFMQSRDPRYDGFFVVAVKSTGVYCRPSCPARLPYRRNVRLFRSVAAAQDQGFRACKRCDPDAAPGSPHWNRRAGVAGRAMRLIADGAVDRDGVGGLAARLHFSERQLNRILVAELGAGPVALARAQRAQSARTLIETTDLRFGEVAAGAGFGSVRQFNDTLRAVYGRTPSELRGRARRRQPPAPAAGALELRLPARQPFDGEALLAFLAARAIPSVEAVAGGTYRRTLRLSHGGAVAALTPEAGALRCELRLDDVRDLTASVARCRRLFDLDADPVAVSSHLGADPLLGPLVRRHPGLRVPGTVDGFEIAVRAIVGQQVSVAGARTILGRLAEEHGTAVAEDRGTAPESEHGTPVAEDRRTAPASENGPPPADGLGLTRRFPAAEALAGADPASLPMPRGRARALIEVARLTASGELVLDAGADPDEAREQLIGIPGIGAWTAGYIAMRALGDPDVFLPQDVGVRHALEQLSGEHAVRASTRSPGKPDDEAWRPWRSYAVMHLWRSLDT
jgi:AraC family transcriptional regulator of adaptative response / DNA-3-methyladenine glycosylase II